MNSFFINNKKNAYPFKHEIYFSSLENGKNNWSVHDAAS